MKKSLYIKILFSLLFVLLSTYYLLIKSELYESQTALMVRDLSSVAPSASFGLSILGGGPDSQTQDSMVVEEYLLSHDMFAKVDETFNLSSHYKGNALDLYERLASDSTKEDILEFYRERCLVTYDETSGLLHIAFSHTNAAKAQEVLSYMISIVENALNEFNRRKALKQLKFIEAEHERNKLQMYASSNNLEEYQNSNLLLDPNSKATTSSSIIASLQAKLTEKRIAYKTKSEYLNKNNYELTSLNSEIIEIKASIAAHKKSLTGGDKSGLNKILFEYEKLKMQLEFDTEIYKNALIQLETIKLDALKEAKTLSIISQPNFPDGYTYPDKPKTIITILLILMLLYGIYSMLNSIIEDHKE